MVRLLFDLAVAFQINQEAGSWMKCTACQFDNRQEAKFCKQCGRNLEAKCPSCGFDCPSDSHYCDECGHRISKLKKPALINYSQPRSYTPKYLADKILTSRNSIEGERKFVTVLFADVADYTSISEQFDPEEVHQIMDGCFKILMDEVHKYEGTINQFTGDGIMALFGAPVACEDHAQRACHVAIKIQEAFEKYSKDLEAIFDIQFKMRIGINSGLVVVGTIGDDLRMDYTAVGDTTNLAARMEITAKPGTILLSENTQRLVKEFFVLESLGKIEIKGKKNAQKVFQLIKKGSVETRIGASVAKGLTRFVGRNNSISTFCDVFEKVKAGRGQIIGIVGEAGVGKSRLLLEIRKILSQGEFEYVEGRCLHYGGSVLYLPVLDILRSIFNIKDSDKEFLIKRKINKVLSGLGDQFKNLTPSFQDILSLKVDDEAFKKLEPKDKREKIFEAIRNLLIRVSQNKPFIIAVEDLHWIDRSSEEFLKYFINWMANTKILLILLYRPEYTHQWGSKSFYSKIGVEQLSMESSGELVKAVLGEGTVAPELRQLISNRSAGNPFFIEEFTYTLLENGSIQKQDDQYVLNGKPEDIQVPDTIHGIIASRLDRLEDNLKKTMQAASVIGREFAFSILQTIVEMENELKSYLLTLQGMEFIYEKNLFPELEYIFKHALTQEVAYNSLLQKRRKEIHEKIGLTIEKVYSIRLEEYYEMLAYHYCKGEDTDKAIIYCKLAGEKAKRNFAHREAYSFFKMAYDEMKRLQESKEIIEKKYELLLLMQHSLAPIGIPEKEHEWVFDRQIELAEKLRDHKRISELYAEKANFYTHRGDNELAVKYTRDAFEEAKKDQDINLIVKHSWALAFAYSSMGNFSGIITTIPRVINILEKNQKEAESFDYPMIPYSILSAFCGLGNGYLGYIEEGVTYCDKSVKTAYKNGDPATIGAAELCYGLFYAALGKWESAVEHLKFAIDHAHKVKWSWQEALGWCCMGYAYSMMCDIEQAKRYADKGLKLHNESNVEVYLSTSYLLSGMVYIEAQQYKKAFELIVKSIEVSEKNKEPVARGRALIFFGKTLTLYDARLNVYKDALEKVNEGMKILTFLKIRPLVAIGHSVLGEIYLIDRSREKANKNFKIALDMFEQMGMDFWANKTQKLINQI